MFHPDVMSSTQKVLLRRLGPTLTERGFYLGGGTAVAVQTGHRRSVDFDWFTAEAIPDPLGLARELRENGFPIAIESVDKGTLHAETEGVRLTFLEYRYPTLRSHLEWEAYGCRLASPEDLACMKLSAIAMRGARRDFVDLYALGRERFDLSEMLESYREKYGARDVGHVVMSLTYFDDAEEEAMPRMLWEVEWGEVKRTIEDWVSDYTRGS